MSKRRNWGRISRAFIPALVLALSVIGISAAGAATENGTAQSGAATVNIEMGDNFFNPAQVTVNVGDTIVWTNTGQRPHDVTADNGSIVSPRRLMNGATFSYTATTPGTITYQCTIHNGMVGTLTVQAAGTGGTTPAATPRTGGGMADAALEQWQQFAALGAVLALVAGGFAVVRLRRAA